MIFTNLTLGEITLRTKGNHQLTGYAEEYLGIWGKRTMFFAVIFGIYSALLAYLIGEGDSFAKLIPGDTSPMFFAISFWIIMTLLLKRGLKGLKKIETFGVITIIIIVLGMFIKIIPSINLTNLTIINTANFTLPFGVVLFALLGFTSIPELRKEIKGQEKLLKKAIILGSLIPIILYILFSSIFIGTLGTAITKIATLSFGPIMIILGIFTMLTSYFVLSYSLQATFKYDIKTPRSTNFILTSLVPLALYVILTLLDLAEFILILSIGGVISGGTTGILILLMARKAKSKTRNKKQPEIKMPINLPIIIIFSLIFLLGIATIIMELTH